jgi:hypothetical protein
MCNTAGTGNVARTQHCRGKKESDAVQRAAGGVTVTRSAAADELYSDNDGDADDAVSDAGTATATAKHNNNNSEYDAMDDGAGDGSDSPTSVTSESFAEGGESSSSSRRVTRGSVSTSR